MFPIVRSKSVASKSSVTGPRSIVTLLVIVVYVASYGPAWSIAARTSHFGILDIYVLLPTPFKRGYVFIWAKLDDKVKSAVFK